MNLRLEFKRIKPFVETVIELEPQSERDKATPANRDELRVLRVPLPREPFWLPEQLQLPGLWDDPLAPSAAGMLCAARPAGGSSNGRTADSDSASLGSNPSPPANHNPLEMYYFLGFGIISVPMWLMPVSIICDCHSGPSAS
jgi:hypothetical protein